MISFGSSVEKLYFDVNMKKERGSTSKNAQISRKIYGHIILYSHIIQYLNLPRLGLITSMANQ